MRVYTEYFDKIHFTESKLEAPVISDSTMRIRATDLFLLRGHPLTAEGFGPHAGRLVFTGVTRSSREVTEYIGGGWRLVDSSNHTSLRMAHSHPQSREMAYRKNTPSKEDKSILGHG